MSKTLLWRSNVGIDGLCGKVNEGWDEFSVVHRTPADNIKLFTLPIVDWTLLDWVRGWFIFCRQVYQL